MFLVGFCIVGLNCNLKVFAILQQNHYYCLPTINWIFGFNNKGKFKFFIAVLLNYVLLCALTILLSCVNASVYLYYLISLLALFCFYVYAYKINKTKLKKSLVKTFRIKRLMALFSVIYLLNLFLVVLMFKTRIDIGVLAVLTINVLSFFIVVISNILIVPLEKIIQLTYIFKAKKKLKCYSHLIVVAITGSYGKTSTKNYLFKMLSEKFCVLKSPHSFNTPMGITKTILDYLKPHHQILILEMGADHKNDIKKLCKIVSPDICVVTAVGKQHLKTFKTFGNIVKTKYQIVEYAKGNALFVTNLTNDVCKCYYEKANLKKVGVDINNKCAYCNLTKLVANDNGLSFSCELDGFKIDLTSKLLGEFNVVNIMLAMSVAYKLGVNIGQICNAVSKLEPVNHRLELKQVNNNVRIIDDSFNSNPLGAKYAVEALKLFNCKRVVITCGMVELGAEQYAENFNFGKLLGCADKVFVVNNVNFAAISDGIRSAGGVEPENFNTFIEAYNCAIENAKEETVILIENDLTDSYIV